MLALLAGMDAQLNRFIERRVNSGDLMLVLRVWADDLTEDGEVDKLQEIFDGQCDSTVAGCEGLVAGEGECDDTADPPVITEAELRCNALMHAVASPDVDSDGDGTPDLLSGAWRISAVPVTIVE